MYTRRVPSNHKFVKKLFIHAHRMNSDSLILPIFIIHTMSNITIILGGKMIMTAY